MPDLREMLEMMERQRDAARTRADMEIRKLEESEARCARLRRQRNALLDAARFVEDVLRCDVFAGRRSGGCLVCGRLTECAPECRVGPALERIQEAVEAAEKEGEGRP